MRIIETTEEFTDDYADPRGGAFPRQVLATGEEGTRNNFQWTYSKVSDSDRYSPRHRHNFSQFRYMLEGQLNFGNGELLEAGEVVYLPEGTFYGPHERDPAARRMFTVQYTESSGAVYLSSEEQVRAAEELREVGYFEDGVFYRETGEDRDTQDGFEAIWEHATGQPLEYPDGRYRDSVFIDPGNFSWVPTGADGVSRKNLGVFSERETRLTMIRVEGGAEWTSAPEDANELAFLLEGSGSIAGDPFGDRTALHASPGDGYTFTATKTSRFLRIIIPTWEHMWAGQHDGKLTSPRQV